MKSDLKSRKKRHVLTAIVGLALAAPAVYLTFNGAFALIGDWWMPICFASCAFTIYMWLKHYNKRSTELNSEVELMLDQL